MQRLYGVKEMQMQSVIFRMKSDLACQWTPTSGEVSRVKLFSDIRTVLGTQVTENKTTGRCYCHQTGSLEQSLEWCLWRSSFFLVYTVLSSPRTTQMAQTSA
ncbi:hypothetical protein AWC38_SpisGene9051 [Stylophora pistillata]|uniref:Uncharacterized protein n=1 Tax=Stylophora pistillata TaxID=50429 RepID=A0A2B4SB51_STYPI|nr:hypothetical protein AWC38_SpisGene9051 [Stylophora pistillata]